MSVGDDCLQLVHRIIEIGCMRSHLGSMYRTKLTEDERAELEAIMGVAYRSLDVFQSDLELARFRQ